MFRPVRRSLPQTLTRALVKAVAVTFAFLVSYVSSAVVADMATLAEGQHDDQLTMVDPATELIEQNDCSTSGLGDEVPASALVRRDSGVSLVPFAEAWAVHQGELPGTLVAVCRAPVSGSAISHKSAGSSD